MDNIIKFIIERFSGYTLILLFLSACILLFVDRRQLEQKGLKSEAVSALVMGIGCVAVAVIAFLISISYTRR